LPDFIKKSSSPPEAETASSDDAKAQHVYVAIFSASAAGRKHARRWGSGTPTPRVPLKNRRHHKQAATRVRTAPRDGTPRRHAPKRRQIDPIQSEQRTVHRHRHAVNMRQPERRRMPPRRRESAMPFPARPPTACRPAFTGVEIARRWCPAAAQPVARRYVTQR